MLTCRLRSVHAWQLVVSSLASPIDQTLQIPLVHGYRVWLRMVLLPSTCWQSRRKAEWKGSIVETSWLCCCLYEVGSRFDFQRVVSVNLWLSCECIQKLLGLSTIGVVESVVRSVLWKLPTNKQSHNPRNWVFGGMQAVGPSSFFKFRYAFW